MLQGGDIAMIPNSANKIVNTTIDISQYINTEYFSINNNVAYLVKVGKLRMIKVDATLKKEIVKDTYIFNFPANFLKGMINTYFFGNLINRSGKPYEIAFYNQLESNNFSILVQVTSGSTLAKDSRLIGEWTGFCSADINDTSEEENKYITQNQFNVLMSETLKDYITNTILEESQNKQNELIQNKDTQQNKLIQKLLSNMINESTQEATSLHVTDASDLPAVLTIEGNHYQEQQEGTDNLAVLNEGSITQDGITVNIEDGVGTVSGANTSDTTTYIKIGTAYLYAGQTYYLEKVVGHGGYSLYKNGKTIWFPDSGQGTHVIPETGEWTIRYSAGANATPITTFKLSIYDTADQAWTQGKKTVPSLEYPSEIETVKDSIKIIQSNKNLFKITANSSSYNGIVLKVDKEEGSVSATGTSTGVSAGIGYVTLSPGDYTFSGGPKNGDWNKQRLSIYEKNSEDIYEYIATIYKDITYSVKLDEIKTYRLNYVIPGATTVNDEKIYPQVETGEQATAFVKHEEKEYNLPIQKEMLKGDKFDLSNNKETHKFGYINTSEKTSLGVTKLDGTSEGFYRYSLWNIVTDKKAGEYIKIYCTHFKNVDSRWNENEGICGWENGQSFCIGTFNSELDTAEKMKNFLLNNNVEIYYELAEQEELDLTEEQKQVLNELNNLELFKGVNIIYTEQDLALLQLNYTVDTKMYIDNKIASQNAESEG